MRELLKTDVKVMQDRMVDRAAAKAAPWPVARPRAAAIHAASQGSAFADPQPCDPASDAATDHPALPDVPMMHGIERRLVRRVEAVWQSLRTDADLPSLDDAAALLGHPFGNQAILFRMAGAGRSNPDPAPVARYVGQRLEALGQGRGSTRSALMKRLTRLAVEAHERGEPAHYDSETESPGIRAHSRGPALMVRAIALPLATAPNGAASVVVVASWREILSQRDTQALQQELATAIAWMQTNGFSATP